LQLQLGVDNKVSKNIITFTKLNSISDYIRLYNQIEKQPELKVGFKKIKIAILASFTAKGMEQVLSVKCFQLGIDPKIHVSDYNQYSQEILDKNSQLYSFNPEVILLFIDSRTIFGDAYFLPYSLSVDVRKNVSSKKTSEIFALVEQIKNNTSAKIILHNLEVPIYSPLGIVENKQEHGIIEIVQDINSALRNSYKSNGQVFIFDYDAFCSKIGKQNIIDYKMYYLGDIKVHLQYIPDLCDEYLAYIKPLLSLSKKCIVLDLDNTLWGGVVGEDGFDGIKLGPTPDGRSFWEFQKYLLSLFQRGIILAINSKNNSDDALKVIREHPYMVLREKHFASMQINWNDKISNMKLIAKDINIGLDSLVFFDDDKLNREMVQDALPQVHVVKLPDDSSLYLKTLASLTDFNTFQLTDEDKRKGQMYAEQRKRDESLASATDINQYLRNLQMEVTIKKADSFTIPRISQLTQKTNQFNMTTRRYLEENILKFSKDNSFIVLSVTVVDKFGDNGIVGCAIIENKGVKWRVDTFLFSCRVIGRYIENLLLSYIINAAKKQNAKILVGEFIESKKNAPARNFYKENGFKLVEKKDQIEYWEYDISKFYSSPDFIKLIEG